MALTIANVSTPGQNITEYPEGPFKCRWIDVTFDSSYPDEGETLTAAALGWRTLVGAQAMGMIAVAANTTMASPHFEVDADKKSIRIIAGVGGGDGALMEEDAAATDLSSHVLRIKVYGN